MKNFSIIITLFILTSGLAAQPFSQVRENWFFTKSDVYSLKIAEVTIKDILWPGDDLAKLAPLGEPKEVITKENWFIGKEITCKYEGFELYLNDLDGIMELRRLRVYGKNSPVMFPDINMVLRVGEPITNYIDNVEAARNIGGPENVIKLDFENLETEGKEGTFKLEGTIIKEMEFWF